MKMPSLSATLLTNITTSAVAGLALLAAPEPIGEFMGGVASWLCRLIGAGLVLFAIGVYGVQRSLPGSVRGVGWVLALDIAWVLATPIVMLVFAGQLNLGGHLLLVDVALLVSGFALLERYWLKQAKHRDAAAS